MKKLFKIFAYLLLSFFALILTLFLIAEFAENSIAKKTLKYVNQSFNADINIDNVNFSLINDFPLASIELEQISIKQAPNNNASDSSEEIIKLGMARLSVQVLPLFNDIINIDEITIKDGSVLYAIDKDSVTNIDFLINETETVTNDTTSTSINLTLKSFKLENLSCIYKDESSNTKGQLLFNHAEADAVLNKDLTKANLLGMASISNCQLPGTPIHLLEEAIVDFDINYLNELLSIAYLKVKTDDSNLSIKGTIDLKDQLDSELYIYETELNLAQLQKYIPEDIREENGLKHIDGKVDIGAEIKGALLDSILPKINLNINISDAAIETKNYPEISNLLLTCNYRNGENCNLETSVVNIEELKFNTTQSKAQLAILIENLNRPKFKLSSKLELSLNEFRPYIPDSLIHDLSGMIAASIKTEGRIPQTFSMGYVDKLLNTSIVDLQFNKVNVGIDSVNHLSNLSATLSYSNHHFNLKSTSCLLPGYQIKIHPSTIEGSFSGKISELNKVELKFDTISLNANSSHINGIANFKNGTTPSYSINSSIDINLNDWKNFVPDSLVSRMSGQILADFNSGGSFNPDSIADDALKLLFTKSKLNLETNQLNITTWDEKFNIEDFNGQFFLADDSMSFKNIAGTFNDTEFKLDTSSISNLYKSVILNQKDTVKILGFAEFGDIDVDHFEKLIHAPDKKQEIKSSETAPIKTALPQYLYSVRGKFSVNSIKYKKAIIENISGLFNISDSLYIVDQLKADAFNGSTKTSVRYEILPDDKTKICFKNATKNLDIHQLLFDFDDFKEYGNNYITHDQLKGALSIKRVDGSVEFIGDSMDMNSLMLGADTITLNNGRLKEYGMAVEMAKLYDMEELKDIQFQTINTKLFIYRNFMYFPATNIVNNAMDVNVYGKQNFGEDCQYHVRLYTSQIFNKGKTDRIEKKQKRKEEKADGKTKGMMVLYAMYQIKDGETKMKPESKGSSERRQIRAQLFTQEGGLKGVFHPRSINYKTGIE